MFQCCSVTVCCSVLQLFHDISYFICHTLIRTSPPPARTALQEHPVLSHIIRVAMCFSVLQCCTVTLCCSALQLSDNISHFICDTSQSNLPVTSKNRPVRTPCVTSSQYIISYVTTLTLQRTAAPRNALQHARQRTAQHADARTLCAERYVTR